jgi:hypothetical protein
MTIYNRPDDLPAFAESGDVVQPTNPEIQTGWPLSTVPPSRQRFNWILNFVSNAVRYFMQRGVAEWSTTEDYPLAGRVQHAGVTWVAILANTGIEPGTDPLTWERWGYSETELNSLNNAYLTKSVAGAVNVTLTAAESRNAIFNFTGALTANINVIIPASAKRFIVRNNTTGAFTLTVKTSGGAGVVVLQGSNTALYCDGTNTDYAAKSGETTAQFDNDTSLATTAFVQRALGNFSDVVTYAVNTVLTAADAGKAILISANATITLPDANSVPAGATFHFFFSGASAGAVQRAGSDVISGAASSTSVSLGIGDTLSIRSNGVSGWLAYGGTARLGSATNFLKYAIGGDQTWQNVLASRAVSTSYQNTTGRPIMVNIHLGGSDPTRAIQVSSNNSTWIDVCQSGQAGDGELASFIVPNLWYYRVNGSVSLVNIWAELR